MKYYTAFLFSELTAPAGAEPLHVTHKYLGELSDGMVLEVVNVIDQYVEYADPILPLPPWPFTKAAIFGENVSVRVLLPKQESTWAFWPELRTLLAPIRSDDFPKYHPHVTTDLPRVDALITCYALIGDGKIIKRWKMHE